MNAARYNQIRRILFSTVHKRELGMATAKRYLEGYQRELGYNGYVGLKAELAFYEHHRRDYSLTVAADVGEHADFSGMLGNQQCRFDVTTTLMYKDWDQYEPFLGQGISYKIALLEHGTFELVDVLELAFERCECGGYLIPCVTLLGQNYSLKGEPTWTNDQLLMDVCAGCETYRLRNRYTHLALPSPSEVAEAVSATVAEDFSDNEDSKTTDQAVQDHALAAYRFFRGTHERRLMSVAQHRYKVTDPKGGGYWYPSGGRRDAGA